MYAQLNKKRAFLRGRASAGGASETAGGPGASPSVESGQSGGPPPIHETREATAQKLSEHHQKLADHFRGSADGGSATKPDASEDSDAYLEAEPKVTGGDGEGKVHEAGESAEVEALEEGDLVDRSTALKDAAEETDDGSVPKRGGSLGNTQGEYDDPLSKFARAAKKKKR